MSPSCLTISSLRTLTVRKLVIPKPELLWQLSSFDKAIQVSNPWASHFVNKTMNLSIDQLADSDETDEDIALAWPGFHYYGLIVSKERSVCC